MRATRRARELSPDLPNADIEGIVDALAALGATAPGTEQQVVGAALEARLEACVVMEADDPATGITGCTGWHFVDSEHARRFLEAADPRLPRRERIHGAIAAGIRPNAATAYSGSVEARRSRARLGVGEGGPCVSAIPLRA